MTLQVTGKNLDIGEALRTYVTDRVEQTLDKYVGSGLSGHVRIEKEHGQFRTDCSIQLRSGLALQSHGEASDAYASADRALERLEKRVRRYRRRLKKRHGPAPQPAATAPYYVIQADGEEDSDEGDNPVIIAETETEITMLANLVSLTPGTLSLDVSSDRRWLFIHAMYVYDREQLVRSVKDGFERRILEVLR